MFPDVLPSVYYADAILKTKIKVFYLEGFPLTLILKWMLMVVRKLITQEKNEANLEPS